MIPRIGGELNLLAVLGMRYNKRANMEVLFMFDRTISFLVHGYAAVLRGTFFEMFSEDVLLEEGLSAARAYLESFSGDPERSLPVPSSVRVPSAGFPDADTEKSFMKRASATLETFPRMEKILGVPVLKNTRPIQGTSRYVRIRASAEREADFAHAAVSAFAARLGLSVGAGSASFVAAVLESPCSNIGLGSLCVVLGETGYRIPEEDLRLFEISALEEGYAGKNGLEDILRFVRSADVPVSFAERTLESSVDDITAAGYSVDPEYGGKFAAFLAESRRADFEETARLIVEKIPAALFGAAFDMKTERTRDGRTRISDLQPETIYRINNGLFEEDQGKERTEIESLLNVVGDRKTQKEISRSKKEICAIIERVVEELESAAASRGFSYSDFVSGFVETEIKYVSERIRSGKPLDGKRASSAIRMTAVCVSPKKRIENMRILYDKLTYDKEYLTTIGVDYGGKSPRKTIEAFPLFAVLGISSVLFSELVAGNSGSRTQEDPFGAAR